MIPVGMGLLCDLRAGMYEVSCGDFGKKGNKGVKLEFLCLKPLIPKFCHSIFSFHDPILPRK
jgi:hypothetical protein